MENKNIWIALSRPPLSALKKIQAGRLSGKTDINPQWRYQAMTELFGPCGIGWKFTVDKKWTEQAFDGQVFAFADVSLYIKDGSVWSDPIPGNGGSMLVVKETRGLHANDEAFKMAITDAIGTAMKMLGVAAEIYAGNFDGSKYINQSIEDTNKTPIAKPVEPQPTDPLVTKKYEMHPSEATDVPDSTGMNEQTMDEAVLIADKKKAISDKMLGYKKDEKKAFYNFVIGDKEPSLDMLQKFLDGYMEARQAYERSKEAT